MNILAIDFGQKRLGLAWMQVGLDIILPYGVVQHQNWKTALPSLIVQEGIQKVVIGNPLGMSGEETENTKTVRAFGDTLSALSGVPVEYYDERFSSQQADAMGGDVSRDEKSAMVILQGYKKKHL